MNKLLVDNKDDLTDLIASEDMFIKMNLEDTSQDINIHVMDNVTLKVLVINQNTANKVTYKLRENATLIVHKLAKNCSDTVTVNLDGRNASVKYITSLINHYDNIHIQNINHHANNTKSKLINHAINTEDRVFHFVVNSKVEKYSNDCVLKQDNKIINYKNGKSFIFPNLLVDNNLVEASHSAYIGPFSKEHLFYLKSRGLSEIDCNQLLTKAFLIGNFKMEDEYQEEIETFIENE